MHITTKSDLEKAKQQGEYISLSLKTEGFIHCSTLNQTVDTANLFFKGQNGLIILCIDEVKLTSDCKYEDPACSKDGKHDSRVDNLFPHVYGPINLDSIFKVVDFPTSDEGVFELPKELETIN